MHAALMWTINDFPAYGMLSRWSTAGKLACPICRNQCKVESLPCSKKISFLTVIVDFFIEIILIGGTKMHLQRAFKIVTRFPFGSLGNKYGK
jgi:hypothetical protein